MVSRNILLRSAQAVLAITLLGVNGYATKWYIHHTRFAVAPRPTILPLFVGAITLVCLLYLFFNAPLQISQGYRKSNPRFFNKWLVLLLDSTCCFFWVVAWIYESVFRARSTLCYENICALLTTSIFMSAVQSLLFLTTMVFAALHIWRTRGKIVSEVLPTHKAWVGVSEKAPQLPPCEGHETLKL